MEPDFWHERWEAGKIGFHQDEINPWLIRFWKDLAPAPGERIFVPLCGKSRDMIWLLDQGYSVVGVELSQIAVESFFTEHHISPRIDRTGSMSRWAFDRLEILCGDFFTLARDDIGVCHGLYDRAALISLPPGMRPAYVSHLRTLLDAAPQGLLITLEYPQHEMAGPPFSVPEEEVRTLFTEHGSVQNLCSADILAAATKFREQGLTRLVERAYRLDRKS